MSLELSKDYLEGIKTFAQSLHEDMIQEVIKICEIPSPSYAEGQVAAYVNKRMQDYGMESYIDEVNNVIAFSPANTSGKPSLMFAAHTDTVFPIDTDVKVKRDGMLMSAPGVGDNSTGVTGIIMLARALQELEIEHGDIYLVGTVCEEGLGDLRGMKTAYQTLKDKVDYFVGVDGGLGGMTIAGIGSRRLKVTVTTGGGHSWGAFGVPSAVHALGKMIAGIADIKVPTNPKTSFNVGVIEGGTSINTIAASASMLIDMRSVARDPLMKVEGELRDIIEAAAKQQKVEYEIEVVGDRPVGSIPADHHVAVTAKAVLDHIGVNAVSRAGSTDCNVPLSDGKPCVCVGMSYGKGAHRFDESMDATPLPQGLEQLILLVSTL